MKWAIIDESNAPSSSISMIGYKFGIQVNFLVC